MKYYLFILMFVSLSCFGFDYGKVQIRLSQDSKMHSFTVGVQEETNNDLIDSTGVQLKYLYRLNSSIRIGGSYTNFSFDESENGSKVREQLLSNGIIQELDYRKQALFLNGEYRIANGVMKFLKNYQAQVYLDLGVGFGASLYESSLSSVESGKFGVNYSLTLGSVIKNQYVLSLFLTSVDDGVFDGSSIKQSYRGLRLGYLW